MRAFVLMSLLVLAIAPAAAGAVRIVGSLDQGRQARTGAIGLAAPGAGPTVTRASALHTLLTGTVESSLLGGTPPGPPLLELGKGPPPDTLVELPPTRRTENRLYPIAVDYGGPRGVLTSDSTRIAGLVSLADVATGRLRAVEVADPLATLGTLQHRIARNDRLRLPLSILAGGIAYLTALFRPRWGPRMFLLALAGNLWLAGWWLVALLAVATVVLPLGPACLVVLIAYLAALGFDPAAVALSPFGPSQAGRFYGVSNLLETFLLVPALLGAALLGRCGVLVGIVAVVGVAGSRFGADGGGMLVLLTGYGVLILRLLGWRITARRAAAVVLVAGAAGVALVGLDALLGSSSHVTHAVGSGPGAVLTDIAERLEASARRTFAGVGPAFAALASLAVLCWVALQRPRTPATDALLAALLVSLVVNDTPGDVLGVGAAAAFTLWRFESVRLASSRGGWLHLRPMRRSTSLLALLLIAVALLAAGCLSGTEVSATPETVVGEVPTATAPAEDLPALALKGDAAAGKELFASNGCGSCHTLADAGSSGAVGPNLDEAKPSYELAVTRVTKGQGAMPAFGDRLEAQQIADVAQYIVESTGG